MHVGTFGINKSIHVGFSEDTLAAAATTELYFFSYTVGSNSKVGSKKLTVGSNKTLMVGSNIKRRARGT